jgi:isocitrate dehydrogenase kinase/phosphatase
MINSAEIGQPGQLTTASANAIKDAFDLFHREFKEINRRSKARFEDRDWHGVQKDAADRLDLYKSVIDKIVADVRALLADNTQNKYFWMEIKNRFCDLIEARTDLEIAETFFNSVTRKIFATVGVDPDIEFIDSDFKAPSVQPENPIYKRYLRDGSTVDLIKNILLDYRFKVDYQHIDQDAKLVAAKIDNHLISIGVAGGVKYAEIVKPIFYRNKAAYIIGRLLCADRIIPLALPLLNEPEGIFVDATLLSENEVSIVFSFTRSYFHVQGEVPHELVDFLKSIMPLKRVAELYISIGYNKHGKTELYRDLLRYLEKSSDKFEIAPGKKGMVMVVFTLPSYDYVFKIIKDRSVPPKTASRAEVMEKYNLVFRHDRAGRLVDVQEYELLTFDKDRFSDELLAELTSQTANSVTIDGNKVVIRHLYTERKMIPLNLYINEMDEETASEVVIDYGNAIKALAAANIFPGDTLLKNFGVTRHGRVVFYDYDEICLITECNFRAIPPARNQDDEFDSEPWFYVGKNDIFPEEFKTFLGLDGKLKEIFVQTHGDLFSVEFWTNMQDRLNAGEVTDIFPYGRSSKITTFSS